MESKINYKLVVVLKQNDNKNEVKTYCFCRSYIGVTDDLVIIFNLFVCSLVFDFVLILISFFITVLSLSFLSLVWRIKVILNEHWPSALSIAPPIAGFLIDQKYSAPMCPHPLVPRIVCRSSIYGFRLSPMVSSKLPLTAYREKLLILFDYCFFTIHILLIYRHKNRMK